MLSLFIKIFIKLFSKKKKKKEKNKDFIKKTPTTRVRQNFPQNYMKVFRISSTNFEVLGENFKWDFLNYLNIN